MTKEDTLKEMNLTPKSILKNSLSASFGLILFGFGVYMVIQANIGAAPWDVFCIGLSNTLGIKYGNASIAISVLIIITDIILGEKIGLGTVLDAILVGKTVDFLNWSNLIPAVQGKPGVSIALALTGFVIEGFSQYFYMKSALSCGPRDSFQIAIGKRLPRVKIGIVNIMILTVVLVIGWILGGPVGINSFIAPFGIGLAQQLAFDTMKFDPKVVCHQNILTSFKILFKGKH